jgi:hypothetical protein
MQATLARSLAPNARTSGARTWTGRVLATLVILFLLVDAAGKVLRLAPYVEGTVRAGFPADSVVPIGLVLLVCTVLFAIPRTTVLGGLFLTAYLGGATATHVRLGQPFVFPVLFGVVVWASLLLRDERLRGLLPFVRESRSLRS